MNSTAVPLVPLILVIAGLMILIVFRTDRGSRTGQSRSGELIDRDEERYWLGGLLYSDPDGRDLFVPRRFGLGLTVNLGHPLGKAILIAPLLVALLPLAIKLLGQR